MSTTAVSQATGSPTPSAGTVEMNIEVVVVPVSDPDRAKEFYKRLGWRLDVDRTAGPVHLIQFTPPGSGCSIQFGTNLTSVEPRSAEDHFLLIVSDIASVRDDLIRRGIGVGELYHCEPGSLCRFAIACDNQVLGPSPDRTSYGTFCDFSDPDGNRWVFQEVTTRIPGRISFGTTSFASVEDLAQAMRRASKAHGEHETRIGKADDNWPDWYSLYMASEQAGTDLPV